MSPASKRTLHDLTATEAADLILRREISSLELVEALLARIERLDPALRSFVTVDAQGARAAAKAADAALQVGQGTGALRGVPFAAKDIYDAEGLPTTAGYPPLAKNVAKADAFTVARMKAAGAVLIGKTVTTQFASGDPSPTRNPWRADRTPGGSSSGSGAAVAARLVPIALGTQTGGSILRPAAYNGVVGLKPTYGRVSRRGIVPLSWTLDHAGPIVRSVEDAALVLGVLAGQDPLDPRSLQADPFDPGAARAALPRPRFGLLADFIDRAEADVRAHLLDVVARLRDAGATVTELRLRFFVRSVPGGAPPDHAGRSRDRARRLDRPRAPALQPTHPGRGHGGPALTELGLPAGPAGAPAARRGNGPARGRGRHVLVAHGIEPRPWPRDHGQSVVPVTVVPDRLAVDQLTQRHQLRWTAVRRAARGPPPRRGDAAARRPPRGRSPGLQRPPAGLT